MTRYAPTWSEGLVQFLNSVAVTMILLVAGLVAIYVAVKTPGMGVPEVIAVCCFAVFFLSKYLVGLAGFIEPVIFLVGLALLFIEVFVTPGFGFMGVSGILCILISVVLALQRFVLPDPSLPDAVGLFVENLLTVFGSIFISLALFAILLRYLPKGGAFKPFILSATERAEQGYVVGSVAQRVLLGRKGLAVTTLRPSGKAEIDGDTLLVVSDSEFIEAGTPVIVAEVRGNRIVVRKA